MKTVSPHKISIIIYAEDPGALNGLLPMAEQLTKAGFSVHMELDGYAATIDYIETENVHKVFKCEENLKRNIYSGLLIGTSENKTSRAFDLIEIAKQLGIPTFAFIDSPANPQYRFSGESEMPLRFAPDYLLVIDQETESAFTDFGFDKDNIMVIKHPYLEKLARSPTKLTIKEKNNLKENTFNSTFRDIPVITFCSELSSGLDSSGYKKDNSYSLDAPEKFVKRTDVVIYNVIQAMEELKRDGNKFKTVLRLHPKQEAEDLSQSSYFDFISKKESAVDVCQASDIVIGMTSMILVEANELNIPVLSVIPRIEERQWIHASLRDYVKVCSQYHQLLDELLNILSNAKLRKIELNAKTPNVEIDNYSNFIKEKISKAPLW